MPFLRVPACVDCVAGNRLSEGPYGTHAKALRNSGARIVNTSDAMANLGMVLNVNNICVPSRIFAVLESKSVRLPRRRARCAGATSPSWPLTGAGIACAWALSAWAGQVGRV